MSSPQAPRMLVVEDHAATRRALVAIFRRKGYRVDAVATLAEGLARLDPPPCCVVLDLMLPDGAGEWILAKVRQDCPQTRVVVATGCLDRQRLDAVRALGPEALLIKPIDAAGLDRVPK
jgi:two-component system response regulator PilR (NtrC family)